MTYESEVLADSPAAYYRMGDASGSTTLLDSSGNGHHGTYSGTATRGAAGVISGTDTSVLFNANGWADAGYDTAASFVMEFWISTSTKGWAIAGHGEEGFGGQDWMMLTNGSGYFQFMKGYPGSGEPTATVSGKNICDGSAHHVVFTITGTDYKIHIDGAVATTGSFDEELWGVEGNVRIGHTLYNQYAKARLDEVAFYTDPLSDARIAAHYAAGGVAVAEPAAQDEATTAVAITLTSGSFTSALLDQSTFTTNAADGNSSDAINTAWWSFTPTSDVRLRLDTLGSTASTSGYKSATLAVFTRPATTLVLQASDYDSSASDHESARLTYDFVAGTTYYIQVGLPQWWSSASAAGLKYRLSATTAVPPPNDAYLDATEVILTDGEYLSAASAFTSDDYTMQPGEAEAEGNGTRTAWWKFTPDVDMNVRIDTMQSTAAGSSSVDTELSIYNLGEEDVPLYVAGDSDSGGSHGGPSDSSYMTIALSGGTTYYIQVGDYNDADPPISYRLHVVNLDAGGDPGDGDVVTVTVDCFGEGFTTIDGDIPHLLLYVPDRVIDRGPAAVSVILTEAIPLVDVTFRFDGTVLAVEPADSMGEIIAMTLTVDESLATAGAHWITATQPGTIASSAPVTFVNDPYGGPRGLIPDLDPIEIPGAVIDGVRHWVLQDLAPEGLGSWVMPVSPATWNPPHARRTLQATHTTAHSGQFHVWESALREATEFTFAGYCPTQEMVEKLIAYSELKHRFYLIDHRNRGWRVAFTNVEMVPRLRQIGFDRIPTDWGHDYTITAVAYGQNWKVPQ